MWKRETRRSQPRDLFIDRDSIQENGAFWEVTIREASRQAAFTFRSDASNPFELPEQCVLCGSRGELIYVRLRAGRGRSDDKGGINLSLELPYCKKHGKAAELEVWLNGIAQAVACIIAFLVFPFGLVLGVGLDVIMVLGILFFISVPLAFGLTFLLHYLLRLLGGIVTGIEPLEHPIEPRCESRWSCTLRFSSVAYGRAFADLNADKFLGSELGDGTSDDLIRRLSHFESLSLGSDQDYSNVLIKSVGELTVNIFNFEYTEHEYSKHHGSSSTTYCQTVLFMRSSGLRLPHFTLSPQGMRSFRLYLSNDYVSTHPNFNQRYALESADDTMCHDVFTDRVRRFYEQHAGWTTEGDGDTLLLFQRSKTVQPAEISCFIDFGLETYSVFKKQNDEMKSTADSLGFTFSTMASESLIDSLKKFQTISLQNAGGLSNVFSKAAGGTSAYIFDFACSVGGANPPMRQTVFLVDSSKLLLPHFVMRPEHFHHKIGSFFGYQDIDFAVYPGFSRNYLLRASDEKACRKAFTDRVLRHYEQSPGWITEGHGNMLLVYRDGRMVRPGELRDFIKFGSNTFRYFSAG